jgi:hypothetical protein
MTGKGVSELHYRNNNAVLYGFKMRVQVYTTYMHYHVTCSSSAVPPRTCHIRYLHFCFFLIAFSHMCCLSNSLMRYKYWADSDDDSRLWLPLTPADLAKIADEAERNNRIQLAREIYLTVSQLDNRDLPEELMHLPEEERAQHPSVRTRPGGEEPSIGIKFMNSYPTDSPTLADLHPRTNKPRWREEFLNGISKLMRKTKNALPVLWDEYVQKTWEDLLKNLDERLTLAMEGKAEVSWEFPKRFSNHRNGYTGPVRPPSDIILRMREVIQDEPEDGEPFISGGNQTSLRGQKRSYHEAREWGQYAPLDKGEFVVYQYVLEQNPNNTYLALSRVESFEGNGTDPEGMVEGWWYRTESNAFNMNLPFYQATDPGNPKEFVRDFYKRCNICAVGLKLTDRQRILDAESRRQVQNAITIAAGRGSPYVLAAPPEEQEKQKKKTRKRRKT